MNARERNGGRDGHWTLAMKSWTESTSLEDDSAAPIFPPSNTEMVPWTSHRRKDWRRKVKRQYSEQEKQKL